MRTRNWSVNLETQEYVADKSLIVSDACGGYVYRIAKIVGPS